VRKNGERFLMDSDSETKLSEKLNLFFTGLEAGLKSLREVRSAFDEEVAFDFNPLGLFYINENLVTDVLAYFLNPEGKHGQKDRLLKVFLKEVGADGAITGLRAPTKVTVSTQFRTEKGRPIDTVITFGGNEFIIGIENKVFYAVDQEKQIHDYVLDIEAKSNKKFLMLYLSPRGEGPSVNSIDPDVLKEYKDEKNQFKIIPFCCTEDKVSVLSILKAMADAARADSVRSFLKVFIKYLETHFQGGTTVAEQNYVEDYLMKHPDFIKEIPALYAGYNTIKWDLTSRYYSAIKELLLKKYGVEVDGLTVQNIDQPVKWAKLELPDGLYITIKDGGIGLYCDIPENAEAADSKECWLEVAEKITDKKLKNFISTLAKKDVGSRPKDWCWRWLVFEDLKFSNFEDPDILRRTLTESSGGSVDFKTLPCCNEVVQKVWDFINKIKDQLQNAAVLPL
jgi:hypothetical protein